MESFCKTVLCQQTNDDVLKKASSNSSDESGREEEDQDMFIQKERAKKARKINKGAASVHWGWRWRESARDGPMRG